jgi:hypothetical protein
MARVVLISCASGAFRRAGMIFGHDPILIDLDELGEAAAEAIEGEQLLTIAEATEEDVERLRGLRTGGGDLSGDAQLEVGPPQELVFAVSDVLDRFAPDMERGPVGDESLMDAQVRQLQLLVTHETPCDKRIGSLESELTSTKSSLEAANNANAQLREQLAGVETKVKELEAAAAGSGDGKPDVEAKPEDKSGKTKAGGKS